MSSHKVTINGYWDLMYAILWDVYTISLSLLPPQFLGSLRVKLQEWLMGCGKKHCSANCFSTEMKLLKSIHDFPNRFTSRHMVDDSITFDDEDLDAWEFEAKRWARVLFLACKEEYQLIPILMVRLFLCSNCDLLYVHPLSSSFGQYILTNQIWYIYPTVRYCCGSTLLWFFPGWGFDFMFFLMHSVYSKSWSWALPRKQ